MTQPFVNQAARPCPTCGAPIPAEAPAGACPRCLMSLGFPTGLDGGAPLPEIPPAEVEARFPSYVVAGTLGRGGMGVVFRARQRALDRDVALKVLPAAPGRGPEFTERFQREARALARLQHPGIVQIFDFGVSSDGWCFLAMELVEGTNLRRVLADRRLPPREALGIVPQICDALQYAHDQGVVHRDIKPENVLLARDGRVKIADFGLAKLVGLVPAGGRAPSLTGTGHVMGTPHYMAPEQIERPGDVDHRADIYSLGVVFYEMLTGELPIGRFPAPSKRSDVDARIDEIVLRTLEKERDARYQRVAEVRTQIDAAERDRGSNAPPPPPPPRSADVPTPAPYPDPRRRLFGLLPPRREDPYRAPPAPPPALSRFAVGVALLPILVGAVAFTAWDGNRGSAIEVRVLVGSMWAAGALFVAIVASMIAWGRVRHSQRKLYGRRFAVISVLGSIVAVGAVAGWAAFEVDQQNRLNRPPSPYPVVYGSAGNTDQRVTLGRPGTVRKTVRYVDGIEVPADARDEDIGLLAHGDRIRELVANAQKVWPTRDPSLLQSVLDYADCQLVGQLEPEIVQSRRIAGTLGLPLAAREFLGAELQAFRVDTITVDPSRTSAVIELTDGTHRVRTRVERSQSAVTWWRFALAPVDRLDTAGPRPSNSGAPTDGPAPPRPPGPPAEGGTEPPR